MGQEGRRQHAVGAHRREALLRLGGRHDLDRQAEALRPAGLALDLLQPLRRGGQAKAAQLVPAGILARLLAQLGVEPDRVLHHLGQADRRAKLADQAGRVPRRPMGELELLHQHHVRPAHAGQVVEDGAAADPSADDDRPRFRLHVHPSTSGIDQSRADTTASAAATRSRGTVPATTTQRMPAAWAAARPTGDPRRRARRRRRRLRGVLVEEPQPGQVALRVGLSLLHVLGRHEHPEELPQPRHLEHGRDVATQGAGDDGHRHALGHPADEVGRRRQHRRLLAHRLQVELGAALRHPRRQGRLVTVEVGQHPLHDLDVRVTGELPEI